MSPKTAVFHEFSGRNKRSLIDVKLLHVTVEPNHSIPAIAMISTTSNHSQARKGTLKNHQLTGYLAGAIGTTALLGASQADAAVTPVSFGFGDTLSLSNPISGATTVGSYGNLFAQASNFGGGSYTIKLGGSGVGSAYFQNGPNGSYAKLLSYGSTVGGGAYGGNTFLGNGFFANSNYINPTPLFASAFANQNIGFKTSTDNFGWANVSYTGGNTGTLTVNSAYVESVPNTPITITAAPEPSRALLALAGLGGLALRRRRKQAA